MQSTLSSDETDTAWQQLAPALDDAMAELAGRDRAALVLRYFENRPWQEVATLMQLTEDAAQKRVTRALEKLRCFFYKRGIMLSASLIAGAVSANSVQVAPLGIAKTISAAAAAKGAGAATSTLTLVKGTLRMMNWTKLKTAIGVGLGALLLVGTTMLVAQTELPPDANFSYKTADDIWQLIHSVDKTKFEMRIFFYSTNRTFDSRKFRVTIQSAVKGAIPVHLGGLEIIDWPHDEALRRENPSVTVSPPQGIGMIFRGDLPVPESLTFRYHQLGDGVAEANRLFATSADKVSGNVMPLKQFRSRGVIFVFGRSQADKANVEILAASGTQTYPAKLMGDGRGWVRLKLDSALLRENPEVKVSEKPELIRLDILPSLKL